jgi:carboxypeptidase PM20D1
LHNNPFPHTMGETLRGFIDFVGPELPFPLSMVFANTWLFKNILYGQYAKTNSGNALIRTSQSITIVRAGVKDNVIPTQATASINYRLLPGETAQSVKERLVKIIADDRVQVNPRWEWAQQASRESSIDSEAFRLLQQSITDVFPDAIVSPMLVLGATDSRHFAEVTDDTYRFTPIRLYNEDLSRIHSINERIAVDVYLNAIQFYTYLMSKL